MCDTFAADMLWELRVRLLVTDADLPTAIGGLHEGRTCYDVLQDAIVANGGTPEYINGKVPHDSLFPNGLLGASKGPAAAGSAAAGCPVADVRSTGGAGAARISPYPYYPTPLGTLL